MPRKRLPTTPKPESPPTLPTRLPRTRKQFEAEDAIPAPIHPCWKYRVLRSDEGSYWWLDGESAIVDEVFAKMGVWGWELVTIYPVGDAIHAPIYYAVFKREVRDG